MKKSILVLFTSLFAAGGFAQVERQAIDEEAWKDVSTCGTMQNMERLIRMNPGYEKLRKEYESRIDEFLAKHPNGKTNNMVITIPTVVHVVWNTSAENISNTAINTLMTMMNQDYGRTNPDANQTPAAWVPIAANTGIQFCLAQRDPSGAPTTGITRTQTTITAFTTDDKVKFTSQGGEDSWNTTQYFNIWICDLSGGLGGYGEFPGGISNTFGNVTDYTLYNSWVVSHESGHCFDLYHIWGDDGTACTGSDAVSDTPNQAGPSSGCPTYPALDACATAAPGYMFMNYMDYGSTSCKNLFTNGQSARANAVLNVAPYNALATSQGCIPVNLVANDAQAMSITSPSGLYCATNFTPVVVIRNYGSNSLTSCIVNYQVDANPVQTYNWSGSLSSLATATITLSPMTAAAGTHTFTCYTSQPNATTDANPGNDNTSSVFNIVPTGQALPLVEGLESATFPPPGWTLDNPDASVTWARTTGAAKTGSASMWFNSINYTCNGCIDIMQTPNLDLSSMGSPQVTFQVAYRMLSDPSASPNWSDTLRVDISTDCGNTWTNLYFKYSTNLTTIIPTFSTTAFVPGPNDWRLETISLAPYASSSNVLLRWKVSSDYENNLYVDDINISGTTGISELDLANSISVYPNPSSGEFTVKGLQPDMQIKVLNMVGEVLHESTAGQKQESISLSGASGIYFLEVKTGNTKAIKKIAVSK